MQNKADAVRDHLYQYNGRNRIVRNKHIMLQGDVLWREDGEKGTTLTSSRGAVLFYTPEEMAELEASGRIEKALGPEAGDAEAEAATRKAERQAAYQDATKYYHSKKGEKALDGATAVAVWDTGNGCFSVSYDGTAYTALNGVSGTHDGMQPSSAAEFNPSGEALFPESDSEHYDRTHAKKPGILGMASSVLARAAGKHVEPVRLQPEALPTAASMARSAVDSVPAQKPKLWTGAEPGDVLAWTSKNKNVHGMGMASSATHRCLVLDKAEDGTLSAVAIRGPESIMAGKGGLPAVRLDADGFEGFEAIPSEKFTVSPEGYYDRGMRGDGKVSEETLGTVRSMAAPKKSALDRMRAAAAGTDQAAEDGPEHDGPDI